METPPISSILGLFNGFVMIEKSQKGKIPTYWCCSDSLIGISVFHFDILSFLVALAPHIGSPSSLDFLPSPRYLQQRILLEQEKNCFSFFRTRF